VNITKNLVFDNNICGCLFATSQTKQACAAARPRPAAAPLRSDLREPVARPGGARSARSAQANLSENVYERNAQGDVQGLHQVAGHRFLHQQRRRSGAQLPLQRESFAPPPIMSQAADSDEAGPSTFPSSVPQQVKEPPPPPPLWARQPRRHRGLALSRKPHAASAPLRAQESSMEM
jgi:hypothetical protein